MVNFGKIPSIWLRLTHEPLMYFLLLGATLFALNAFFETPTTSDTKYIDVTKVDIERLKNIVTRRTGEAPTTVVIPSLVEDYIRQEVLFREGRALGLESDDPVVRNRIILKMESLLNDSSSVAVPTEAEIGEFFNRYRERYLTEGEISFIHIYFDPTIRGAKIDHDARETLAALSDQSINISQRGDPYILSTDPTPYTRKQLTKDFGAEFSDALAVAPLGIWVGPIRSAVGTHLVRVIDRTTPHVPDLGEVYARVRADLIDERQIEASAATYERIKSQYKIRIQPGALGSSNQANGGSSRE